MRNLREDILEQQLRSFCEGTLEEINGEWIFFDNENDEAFPLEQFLFKELYVNRKNSWKKGILIDNLILDCHSFQIKLKDYDQIRIQKSFSHSFKLMLQELEDETFIKFTSELNNLDFSLYDTIYCHNQLSYILANKKVGVNFICFDNTEKICAVQHHFHYDGAKNDRFEFTLNTGERMILQEMKPPFQI